MGKNGKFLTYDQQCLIAIARALPTDDIYRRTIQDEVEDGSNRSLEVFTESDPEIPVFCGCGQTESVDLPMTLANLMEYGDRSGIAQVYGKFCALCRSKKPRAIFIRTAKPTVVNLVLHSLHDYRASHDQAILHTLPFDSPIPVIVERRTTFCKLFARIGMWAWDREGYTLPMNWDEPDDDLRKKKPETRLEWAKSLVFGWGYRRSRSKIFRDLSDSEFVEVVMEMQMQKMVESTRAKR